MHFCFPGMTPISLAGRRTVRRCGIFGRDCSMSADQAVALLLGMDEDDGRWGCLDAQVE